MRATKEVKQLAAANEKTMLKAPSFEVWSRRHLRCKDRSDKYEKAFTYINRGDNEQEAFGLESPNEDSGLSPL